MKRKQAIFSYTLQIIAHGASNIERTPRFRANPSMAREYGMTSLQGIELEVANAVVLN